RNYTLYVKEFTDERYETVVGDEVHLALWPDTLDAALAALYGRDENRDDHIAAGADNREYASLVARLQLSLTATAHLLIESSIARELSSNGKLWREHYNSLFQNNGAL